MDDDYAMTEDIVSSTEVNGNHGTVDPSVITLDGHIQSPLPIRKEPLPILSHQPVATPPNADSYPSPIKDEFEDRRESSSESPILGSGIDDAMDLESSPEVCIQVVVPPPPKYQPLPYATGRTGLVYDVRMRFHTEPPHLVMADDIHPEDPRRIHEIFEAIRSAGLVQGPDDSDDDAEPYRCFRIAIRPATKGEVCLIHTEEHWNFIKSLRCM